MPDSNQNLPRRLRRLHRVWRDRDGYISYLLTLCVDGRASVLNNEAVFGRLVSFLLDSATRYQWFGRRFVVMPDHMHLIAHQGPEAIRLGQWIKALKAVVGGLKRRRQTCGAPNDEHAFTRAERAWRWQAGFHDHKFRTPESESRKWEYVCLNPVRYHLVPRPEDWPFGGEIFYQDASGSRFVRGTPPLLEQSILIDVGRVPPRGGSPE